MFYLSALLLYFPRLLPGVETQPWATLALAFCALLLPRSLDQRTAAIALLTFALVLLGIKGMATGDIGDSLSGVQILIGPTYLFAAEALSDSPPRRKVMATIAIATLALAGLELGFPSVYRQLAGLLLDRAAVADGLRGISLLTPEPSYAAISLAYLLMLALWSNEGNRWGLVEWAFLIALLLTFSTYAVVLLGVILLFEMPVLFLLSIGALVVAVASIVTVGGGGTENTIRAVGLLAKLTTLNFQDFLPSISALDSSVGSRLITNFAALQTPLFAPMGLGLGCSSMAEAYKAVGYGFVYSNPVLAEGMQYGCLKPQSYLPCLLLVFGWISLPVTYFGIELWRRCSRRNRAPRIWSTPLGVGLLMIVTQGQITNPIPWILIYMSFHRFAIGKFRSMAVYEG